MLVNFKLHEIQRIYAVTKTTFPLLTAVTKPKFTRIFAQHILLITNSTFCFAQM